MANFPQTAQEAGFADSDFRPAMRGSCMMVALALYMYAPSAGLLFEMICASELDYCTAFLVWFESPIL